MATASMHPVRILAHSHERLNGFAREIGRLLRLEHTRPSAKTRAMLKKLTTELRDELIDHFANEEEGLFPFLREQVAAQADGVNRLEAAHDAICGAMVRFERLLASDRTRTKAALNAFQRFEYAYNEHSLEEEELLQWLDHVLSSGQQRVLAEYLRGLA